MIITNLFFPILLVSVSAKPFVKLFDPFGTLENIAKVSFGVMGKVAEASFGGRSPFQIVDHVLKTPGMIEGVMDGTLMDNLNVGRTSGVIFLHGAGPFSTIKAGCQFFGPAVGLSMLKNKMSCPVASPLGNSQVWRSWFIDETEEDLNKAMMQVEEEIRKMKQEGIPSENIVLAGASQGGAVALYTAMHTQYKLGGFIPIITWLPRLQYEDRNPINKGTPIFHLNGADDTTMPHKGATTMKQVFTNYQFKITAGNHLTTLIDPVNHSKIYCWLKKNVPNMAFSTISHQQFVPCDFLE